MRRKPPVRTANAAGASSPSPEQQLRGEVRKFLSTLPKDRAAPVSWIASQINKLTGLACDEGMVQGALDWNHDRGWVDYRFNNELEWDEWFITSRGKQQEGTR